MNEPDMDFARAELKRRIPGAFYRVAGNFRMSDPITINIFRRRSGFLGYLYYNEKIGTGSDRHSYARALLDAISRSERPATTEHEQ